jgi:hypothetical protein
MNAISETIYQAQKGVARLAADGVNVQIEVEQILVAFEARQADAMERAERLRDRLVTEATGLIAKIDLQQQALEGGISCRFPTSSTATNGYIAEPINPEPAIARATALASAASHVSDLIEVFKNLRLKDADLVDGKGLPAPGPTTETLYHLRHMKGGDPILRLRAAGKLTDDHVRSAREIEAVQRWATTGLGMKIQRLPVKIDASDETTSSSQRSPHEHQEHMALLHAVVYVPWTHGTTAAALQARVKSKACAAPGEDRAAEAALMVLQMIAGDSLKLVAGAWQMRSAKALDRVQSALDRYAKMRGEFSRGDSSPAKGPRSCLPM